MRVIKNEFLLLFCLDSKQKRFKLFQNFMSGYITPPTKPRPTECPLAPLRRRLHSYTVHSNTENLEDLLRVFGSRIVSVERAGVDHLFVVKTFYSESEFNDWIQGQTVADMVLVH